MISAATYLRFAVLISLVAVVTAYGITANFSWERVPQWQIVRKRIAFSDEEIRSIATASIVVLEKGNGYADAGCVEEGVLRAARAIKEVNRNTIVLFYWNAVINYGDYRANEEFERNAEAWSLKKSGKLFLFKERFKLFNLIDREFQEWWVKTALAMAAHPEIDGVFIDAINKITGTDNDPDQFYQTPDYAKAYMMYATQLKRDLGDKMLIGNAIRVCAPGTNMQHLAYLDGSYIERWAFPVGGASFEDYVVAGMEAMIRSLSMKKIILFNATPDVIARDAGPKIEKMTYAEKETWMKENIRFPLAVFLVLAEPLAFFHWGTGPDTFQSPTMDVWRNDIYEEMGRPLGKPFGRAKRDGFVYTRSFEHLDVRVDVKNRTAELAWR